MAARSSPSREPGGASAPTHSLLAPAIANVFQQLDVGLTLWQPPARWREIYERPVGSSILAFETQHGRDSERVRYNARCIERAMSSRKVVVGEHSGFTDLFVPIGSGGRVRGLLVTGPYATTRPTSASVTEIWRSLTGRQADPKDPEFSKYLAVSLSILVLDADAAQSFRCVVENAARLLAGEGSAAELIAEIDALGKKLVDTRFAERMWSAAADLVDARTERIWTSPTLRPRRRALGIQQIPDSVLVGLFVNRLAEPDPISEALRRDRFLRACVAAARDGGHASGRISDSGFSVLCARRGSDERTFARLADIGDSLVRLGRRHGFGVHLGACAFTATLSEQFRAALGAAELALSKDTRIVRARRDAPALVPLGPLQRELGRLLEQRPDLLSARFDRYLETVSARSGLRLDLALARIEAAFDRIVEAYEDAGVLDVKAFTEFCAGVSRAAAEARTLEDLFGTYRTAVASIVATLERPGSARRDHSLRRAEQYIQTHFTEPLTLTRVARVAGFSAKYFSSAFRAHQGTTFEGYLVRLRLERARQLLSSTAHPARPRLDRVARLSGFSSTNYLCRVFREQTGETPLAFRRRVLGSLVTSP